MLRYAGLEWNDDLTIISLSLMIWFFRGIWLYYRRNIITYVCNEHVNNKVYARATCDSIQNISVSYSERRMLYYIKGF